MATAFFSFYWPPHLKENTPGSAHPDGNHYNTENTYCPYRAWNSVFPEWAWCIKVELTWMCAPQTETPLKKNIYIYKATQVHQAQGQLVNLISTYETE